VLGPAGVRRAVSTTKLLEAVIMDTETLFMFGGIPYTRAMDVHLQHCCPKLWNRTAGNLRRGSV
jgi:hypothetical protein